MPRQVFFNFRSLPNFSITFGVLLDSAPSIAVCCLSERGPHTTEWAPLLSPLSLRFSSSSSFSSFHSFSLAPSPIVPRLKTAHF